VGGMYDPTYDVEAEKARHARERAGKRAALRAEGRFDEDGNPMDAAFDRGLARRLLSYLKPYRKAMLLAVALLVTTPRSCRPSPT
jgi:hypothetical protein